MRRYQRVLQSYDTRLLVLLIDDQPSAASDADAMRLRMMRALPGQVRDLLESEAENLIAEREAFEPRRAVNKVDAIAETRWFTSSFERASDWFARQVEAFDPNDHGEAIFRDKIFLSRRDALLARTRELSMSHHQLTEREIAQAYDQLVQIFSVEITSFERKRYVNLSPEFNKAVNLNSYLAQDLIAECVVEYIMDPLTNTKR